MDAQPSDPSVTEPKSTHEAPRVTVVVPAHNAGRFVTATLESIRAQTVTDWQAVVIDDCSTDDTAAVVQGVADSDARIELIRLERNSGPAAARNAGILAAVPTELIALLDADDLWRADYLEKQIARYDAALEEGRKVGIVACDAAMLKGDRIAEHTWFDLTGWIDPITYEAMLERSYIFVSAVFPRSAWEEVGGFAVECWGSEDYDLWLQLLEHGYEAVASREALAVYRVHEASLTHSRLRVADAHIAAYRRALGRGPKDPRCRRTIRRELRHYRALRRQAIALDAFRAHGVIRGGALALRALPLSLVAVLQRPGRWAEWAGRVGWRSPKPRRGVAALPGDR